MVLFLLNNIIFVEILNLIYSDNYSETSSIREDVNSKLVRENDKAADSEKTL